MSQVNVAFVNFFLPVLAYLLVALVVIAVLAKTKLLGENKWLSFLAGLAIAAVFVATAGSVVLINTIIPWFAVLLVCLFLVMIMVGFVGGLDDMKKTIGKVFIWLLLLTFVFSAFYVYSETIRGYAPGPAYGYNADISLLYFTDYIWSPEFMGAVVLIGVSGFVAWIILRGK